MSDGCLLHTSFGWQGAHHFPERATPKRQGVSLKQQSSTPPLLLLAVPPSTSTATHRDDSDVPFKCPKAWLQLVPAGTLGQASYPPLPQFVCL